ncbi:MAG: type II toxin-antitoxin system VapC family toxin [Rhodomicrobium sp.]
MIVLDTNVLSEEMKLAPAPEVHRWLLRQNADDLFTTAISEAEILAGVAAVPDGRRKRELESAARSIFDLLSGRIIAFDRAAAPHFAEVLAARRRAGRPIDSLDAQIASIARAHGFAVATRDATGFELTGIEIINPWQA